DRPVAHPYPGRATGRQPGLGLHPGRRRPRRQPGAHRDRRGRGDARAGPGPAGEPLPTGPGLPPAPPDRGILGGRSVGSSARPVTAQILAPRSEYALGRRKFDVRMLPSALREPVMVDVSVLATSDVLQELLMFQELALAEDEPSTTP